MLNTGRVSLMRSPLLLTLAASLAAIVSACGSSGSDTPSPTPQASVALRYQADDGRQALLEISPFEIGRNSIRVTVMDSQSQPAAAASVRLHLSRLENVAEPIDVPTTSSDSGKSYLAESELRQTGWWDIGVVIDTSHVIDFYLRLDDPSGAPLSFASPDYASDPAAQQLFRRTVQGYQQLATVKTSEELTSGLLAPTGIGALVVTDGETQRPDRVHYTTRSTATSGNEVYRVGDRSCSRNPISGSAWDCAEVSGPAVLDLSYLDRSTAFRLGRSELVDREDSQAVLFYNPGQQAWFAWWVGKETGYLRRQAMVAPGHFMLTRYFDHNVPVEIAIPPDVSFASRTPQ